MSSLFGSKKTAAPVIPEPERDDIPGRKDEASRASAADQALRARKRRGRRSLLTAAAADSVGSLG